jgi:hypothetical protein
MLEVVEGGGVTHGGRWLGVEDERWRRRRKGRG